MIDKMSDASRLVDNLLKKDFVIKRVSEIDRRHTEVIISEKGLMTLEKMDKLMPTIEKKHFAALLDDEINILNNLLDKLRG